MQPNDKTKTPAFTWEEGTRFWTWRQIVIRALAELGGTASLKQLCSFIEPHPKTQGRKHWRNRVRATLEGSDHFLRVDKGVWSFTNRHSEEEVARLRALRRALYPLKKRAES